MKEDIVLGITAPEDDGQTPLDPDEARGLLLDWVATRADLNVAEEQNIAGGIAWGVRSIKRQPVLTQSFLRTLHQKMLGQVWAWAGRYRDTERNIGVAPHAIASEIKILLDDAKAWDEFDTYPVNERAVRLHHRLTAVHPFPNGNGRCSRVFVDLYLEQHGARQFTWGAGMPVGIQREAYIAALRAADAHDYAPLLAFVRR
jgi:Fic-DOC domain mobile mystery protein B